MVQQGQTEVVDRLRPGQARLRGRGGGGDDDVRRGLGDSVSAPASSVAPARRTSPGASGEPPGLCSMLTVYVEISQGGTSEMEIKVWNLGSSRCRRASKRNQKGLEKIALFLFFKYL